MSSSAPVPALKPVVAAAPGFAAELAVAHTRAWLERAVIGLNLCPFAKAVHGKQLIHFAVSGATAPADLLAELARELSALVALPDTVRETTLLIAPQALTDFLAFNDFMRSADRLVRRGGHVGVVQLAGFHPAYCFAGADDNDVGNYTNRSPYPTIHLLREDSVERAVSAFPDPARIYEANIETLQRLGPDGWAALQVGPP